jgi:hypothetical protein
LEAGVFPVSLETQSSNEVDPVTLEVLREKTIPRAFQQTEDISKLAFGLQ